MIREYIIKVDDAKTDIMGGTPLEEPPKEVIRCMDCMYAMVAPDDNGYFYCKYPFASKAPHEAYFYCASGKREDTAKELETFLRDFSGVDYAEGKDVEINQIIR